MYNTNLAFKEEINELPVLDYLFNELKDVFNLSEAEFNKIQNSAAAKIIATLPFAAGCSEPERTAIAHLSLYMAEIRGFQKYYAHLPSDDSSVYKRLNFISRFDDGNREVIEYGMDLLALIMIEGYHKSENSDKKNNIYNPFVSKAWNYRLEKAKLMKKIRGKSNDLLDGLFIALGPFW